MRRWQSGKRTAMDEVYRRYSTRLLHYMMRLLNYDEALAQDLLHDVFMTLIERPGLYDAERPFRPYLFTMASNACRKHYRQRNLQPMQAVKEEDSITAHSGYDAMVGDDLKLELKLALAELSYEHRTVFILRFQERFSVRETADIMDCNEGTVKSRSHHCLQQLSKRLSHFQNSIAS